MSEKKQDKQPSQEKKNKDLPVDDQELTDQEADKVAGGGCGCTGMSQDPITSKKPIFK